MGAPVPAVAAAFVGRVAELAAIAGMVERERLVTLVGPGGSGKTRLAVQAAGSFDVLGLDVLGFVELAPVEDGIALPGAVLAGCGIRNQPGRDRIDRLHDRLADARGVLVLDNCEQVRDEVAALVAGLLRACPGLRVLATSRVTLGVAGETVLPIGGMGEADAAALFLDRARRVQPALPSGAATNAAARTICRLADGLPLAFELAAAHARALSLSDVEAGMADRLEFLTTRDPGLVPQHRSLLASIDRSAALVGPQARRALSALSVFGGRFTLDAALAVAGPGGRAAVETLVDHSLVQFDAVDGRYVLLDTIRDYAAREPDTEVHPTLLRWVARLAADTGIGLGRADPAALTRVSRDDAAVRTALDHALRTRTGLDLAAGIVVDLAFAWSLRGRCAEAREWADGLRAALDPVPPAVAWAAAFHTIYSGDLETGFGLAVTAVDGAAADPWHRARSLILVGMVQMFVDPAGADPVLAEAADLAEAAGDDWGRVEALQTRAYTHLSRNDHRAALDCVDAALPALDRLGHDQLRAWDAAIRADVAAQTGRFADACTHGRAGLDLAVAIGEPVSAGGAVLPLVRALNQLGRTDDAATATATYATFVTSHPGLGTVETADLAAAMTACWTRPAAAEPRIAAALAAVSAAGVPGLAGEAAALLAVARLACGDPAGARSAADVALEWAGAIGNRETACAATLARCAADRALGADPSDGAHHALVDAAVAGLRPLVPDALDMVAGLALDAGRPAVAARLHAASGRLRAELGSCVSPLVRTFREADTAAAAAALITAAWTAAHEEGGRLGPEQAVAYATRSRGGRTRPRAGWESLTPTEREVVAVATRGLSNPAIAAELLIGTGTVRTHLRSVFGKLGVTSRAELAAYAARRGL